MQTCKHCKEQFDDNLRVCPKCGHKADRKYTKTLVHGFFYFVPYFWNFLEKTLTLALAFGIFFIPMIATVDDGSLPYWDMSFTNLVSMYDIIMVQVQKLIDSEISWTNTDFLSMGAALWVYLGFVLIEIFWFIPRWFISFFALLGGNSKKNRHRVTDELIAKYYHVQHDLGSLGGDKTLFWVLFTNGLIFCSVIFKVPYVRCFDCFYDPQMFNMGTILVISVAGLDVLVWIFRKISMTVLKSKIKKAYRLKVFKPLKKLYSY